MAIIEWHPAIVHFPLALMMTATVCLTLARMPVVRHYGATLATVGTWNLCMGAISMLAALGTGLAAVGELHIGAAARAAISLHVKSAVVTAVLAGLAAVWRGAGSEPDSRPTGPFLLVLWIATIALTLTGYRGGQNVYRYAVGVSAASPLPAPP